MTRHLPRFPFLANARRLLLFVFLMTLLVPVPKSWGTEADAYLKAQIGQMLMIGFRGLEVDQNSPVVQDIRSGRIGGGILFDYDVALRSQDRNIATPEQLAALVADLHAASPDTPLFVAIDQEGGRVNRLKERYGFPPSVSQGWLGQKDDPRLTADFAHRTAKTLSAMGINVNLAPVVDVNVNPDNPIIGKLERSFSADPLRVAAHAEAVISAHQVAGVLTALKHFPGHGSSTQDSHLGFTDVTRTWSEMELEPYRQILRSVGADMIMTAHVFNARLDPNWPATLSAPTLQGLLRDKMGYQGVIISDDMQMQAITDHYDLETALEQTILAGTDVIIFGNNLVHDTAIAQKAGQIILELVRKGRIPASRIQESHARIMHLKSRLAARGDLDCRLCDHY
ncbi:glycoside hydrolase family 3 protein [Desulfonatronum thioautotrophicum]|uniref:glycoside hydrolase family 3 protein n=1 Tax=Desulfonatronum thioautotrophicum TaxID=617001 RepID=UPI00069A61D7|nr:glycoside hydrolase family 3 protein [Desulfonatronum thioautotrophicum]